MLRNPALFAAVGVAVVLAAVLFAILVVERRREGLRQRLSALTNAARGDMPRQSTLSLRKVQPGGWWVRLLPFDPLEAELAATGNRTKLWHLMAAAAIGWFVLSSFVNFTVQPGPIAAFLAGVAAAIGAPILVLRWAQRRYQNQFLRWFPDALDLVVRAVKAGLPAFEAIAVAAREIPPPVCTELQKALDETGIGVQLEEALQQTADRIRVADFRFFVVSLVLQRRSGGSLAETLTILSTVIRQRKIAREKAKSLTVETKLSSIVISVMPFVATIGFSIIKPDLVRLMVDDSRGRFMLGVAIVMWITGILLMRHITKRMLR